jgi:hypothetical protein
MWLGSPHSAPLEIGLGWASGWCRAVTKKIGLAGGYSAYIRKRRFGPSGISLDPDDRHALQTDFRCDLAHVRRASIEEGS